MHRARRATLFILFSLSATGSLAGCGGGGHAQPPPRRDGADLLANNGAVVEAVQAGIDCPALRNALAELRGVARARLGAFADASAKSPTTAAVFLPVSLCALYLREMERRAYEPFETVIRVPQWRRQWRLWRAAKGI